MTGMKYELKHDRLAEQVFDKASAESKARRRLEMRLLLAYERYQESGQRILLRREDLEEWRLFADVVELSPAVSGFVRNSEEELERQEWEAEQERRRELEKERRLRAEAEAYARRARRRTRVAWGLAVLSIAALIYAGYQSTEVVKQKNIALAEAKKAGSERNAAEIAKKDAVASEGKEREAREKADSLYEVAKFNLGQRIQAELETVLSQARELAAKKQFEDAVTLLNQATGRFDDNLSKERLRQEAREWQKAGIDQKVEEHLLNGKKALEFNVKLACKCFNAVRELDSQNPEVQQLLLQYNCSQ